MSPGLPPPGGGPTPEHLLVGPGRLWMGVSGWDPGEVVSRPDPLQVLKRSLVNIYHIYFLHIFRIVLIYYIIMSCIKDPHVSEAVSFGPIAE